MAAAKLEADAFAAVITAASARRYEQLSPDLALQGCLLAMRAHDIGDELIVIAGRMCSPGETHPSFAQRAAAIVEYYRTTNRTVDERKGGQVIDLRPGAARREHRDPNVKYGLIIIYAADGTVQVDVKEPKGMFGVIVDALRGTVVDLGKAGIEALADGAKAAVGDNAEIELRAQGRFTIGEPEEPPDGEDNH